MKAPPRRKRVVPDDEEVVDEDSDIDKIDGDDLERIWEPFTGRIPGVPRETARLEQNPEFAINPRPPGLYANEPEMRVVTDVKVGTTAERLEIIYSRDLLANSDCSVVRMR